MSSSSRKVYEVNSSSSQNGKAKVWIIVAVVLILIVIALGCYCQTDHFKQHFGNVFGGKPNLADLQVVMFIDPEHQMCQQLLEVFDKEGVLDQMRIVNVTTEDGKKLAASIGVDKVGVPAFISEKNQTAHAGPVPSVKELINKLKKDGSSPKGGISDMKIVLFARPGCKYCDIAKQVFGPVMDQIDVVDVTTPEGDQIVKKIFPSGISGVPVFKSMKTGKHVTGFDPVGGSIEKIVSQLK